MCTNIHDIHNPDCEWMMHGGRFFVYIPTSNASPVISTNERTNAHVTSRASRNATSGLENRHVLDRTKRAQARNYSLTRKNRTKRNLEIQYGSCRARFLVLVCCGDAWRQSDTKNRSIVEVRMHGTHTLARYVESSRALMVSQERVITRHMTRQEM